MNSVIIAAATRATSLFIPCSLQHVLADPRAAGRASFQRSANSLSVAAAPGRSPPAGHRQRLSTTGRSRRRLGFGAYSEAPREDLEDSLTFVLDWSPSQPASTPSTSGVQHH